MAEDALVGRTLGSAYGIEKKLGAGGIGAVYSAVHARTGRRYAVKVLLPEVAMTPGAAERFRREAQALAALGHASIIAIHDFDITADGTQFLVMDLLEGEDLAERLAREGALEWTVALRFLEEVGSALAAAHAVGIVHRDLKPANVFLARQPGAEERATILDFGLVKNVENPKELQLTATGMALGTPLYMAPEQAHGIEVDGRADVYALGGLLFEMLTGHPPFEGPTLMAVLARVLTEPPPSLSSRARGPVPDGIDDVVRRALAKSPGERPPTVAAFLDAVRDAARRPRPRVVPDVAAFARTIAAAPTPNAPPTPSAPPGSDVASLAASRSMTAAPRRRVAWALGSLVLLVVGAAVGTSLRSPPTASAPLVAERASEVAPRRLDAPAPEARTPPARTASPPPGPAEEAPVDPPVGPTPTATARASGGVEAAHTRAARAVDAERAAVPTALERQADAAEARLAAEPPLVAPAPVISSAQQEAVRAGIAQALRTYEAQIASAERRAHDVESFLPVVLDVRAQARPITRGAVPAACAGAGRERLSQTARGDDPATASMASSMLGALDPICTAFEDWEAPPAALRQRLANLPQELDYAERMLGDAPPSAPADALLRVRDALADVRRMHAQQPASMARYPCRDAAVTTLQVAQEPGNAWAGAAAQRVYRHLDRACSELGMTTRALANRAQQLEARTDAAQQTLRQLARTHLDLAATLRAAAARLQASAP